VERRSHDGISDDDENDGGDDDDGAKAASDKVQAKMTDYGALNAREAIFVSEADDDDGCA